MGAGLPPRSLEEAAESMTRTTRSRLLRVDFSLSVAAAFVPGLRVPAQPLPAHALRAHPSFQACSNRPRLKRNGPLDGSCARLAGTTTLGDRFSGLCCGTCQTGQSWNGRSYARRRAKCEMATEQVYDACGSGSDRSGSVRACECDVCEFRSRRGVFGDVRAAVLEERSGGARSIVQDARAHVSWKGS